MKISPAYGGSDDITRHAETPGHIKQAPALKGKRIFHSFPAGFTCSKLTIETLEQGVKYVQS